MRRTAFIPIWFIVGRSSFLRKEVIISEKLSVGKFYDWQERYGIPNRRNCFLSIEDARKIIDRFIDYYNNKRLHSAIDYVAPLDILLARKEEILKSRDEKLRKAREKRIEYYNQKSTLFGNAKVSYFR